MSIQELLPEVQENVLLAQYTTFKIGGNAKYFFTAKKREEIIKAVKAAQQCDLSFFILANGSNVLFSDNGFDGLVIKLENTNNELRNNTIYAQAGVMLSSIVNIAEEAGLSGLEWAGGIPGTVGGAVRGNAGAFDSSVSDIVKSVEALDVSNLEIKNYKIEDCEFGYRNSIFKKNKNLIILSIEIELQKGDRIEIEKQIQEYKNYRKEHHPLKFSSAGSIFKNPSGFSAGELIEKSGLKGKIIGDAQISEKHCNFIINLGRAEAKDVLALINLVKKEVKNKFDINIEEEIMIV
jgi:UDP-N-acetylmuramate dehydrogenase